MIFPMSDIGTNKIEISINSEGVQTGVLILKKIQAVLPLVSNCNQLQQLASTYEQTIRILKGLVD